MTDLRDQAAIKVGKEGYVIILDKDKHVVVSPVQEIGTKEESGVLDAMYESKEGQFDYVYEERSKTMIFSTNEATGWKIAGTMFKSEVTDASKEIRLATLMVLWLLYSWLLSLLSGLRVQ